LPIVGHDTPRLRWVLGDAPLLCDTENPAALGAALAAALKLGRGTADPAVQRYSWPAIAREYDRFLRDLHVAAA
jgi:glycosyltransferase involved in cell wall biosynthesis